MVATLVIVFIPPSIHKVNFYLLGEILLPFCLNYTKQERERERERERDWVNKGTNWSSFFHKKKIGLESIIRFREEGMD